MDSDRPLESNTAGQRTIFDRYPPEALLNSIEQSEDYVESGSNDHQLFEWTRAYLKEVIAERQEAKNPDISSELKGILRKLHSPEDLTLEFAYSVQEHAERLSTTLCAAFSLLQATMERHEPLIRRRWARKTCGERQEFLLSVFPTIPKRHGQDHDLALHE